MRENLRHWQTTVVIVAVAALFSWPNRSEAQPAAKFSGEELLMGAFLGAGPVAEHLPELWRGRSLVDFVSQTDQATLAEVKKIAPRIVNATPDGKLAAAKTVSPAAYTQFAKLVVARMAANDPKLLSRVQKDFTSGKHQRIQSTFAVARRAVGEAVLQILEKPPADSQIWCRECWVEVAIAGYAVVAVAAFAVIATVVKVPQSDSDLATQTYVDLIATRLFKH